MLIVNWNTRTMMGVNVRGSAIEATKINLQCESDLLIFAVSCIHYFKDDYRSEARDEAKIN